MLVCATMLQRTVQDTRRPLLTRMPTTEQRKHVNSSGKIQESLVHSSEDLLNVLRYIHVSGERQQIHCMVGLHFKCCKRLFSDVIAFTLC